MGHVRAPVCALNSTTQIRTRLPCMRKSTPRGEAEQQQRFQRDRFEPLQIRRIAWELSTIIIVATCRARSRGDAFGLSRNGAERRETGFTRAGGGGGATSCPHFLGLSGKVCRWHRSPSGERFSGSLSREVKARPTQSVGRTISAQRAKPPGGQRAWTSSSSRSSARSSQA